MAIHDVVLDFRNILDGDGSLALCTPGFFLMELGLFVSVAYLTSYCIAHGMDEAFSHNILAILEAASVFGRALPGFVADKLGRYNTNAVLLLPTAVTALAIWLPLTLARPTGAGVTGGAIVFAIMFGSASGSNLSLTRSLHRLDVRDEAFWPLLLTVLCLRLLCRADRQSHRGQHPRREQRRGVLGFDRLLRRGICGECGVHDCRPGHSGVVE